MEITMKIPKLKKSTLIILLLLAVFAVVALLTTPLLNNKTNKPSLDLFDTEDEEENGKSDDSVYTDPSTILLFDNPSVPDKNYSAAELAKLDGEIERAEKKLSNESFTAKAPAAVVEGERAKLQKYIENRAGVAAALAKLS